MISSEDLTLLRDEGHRVEYYMSFLVPRDLWTAQIDDASIEHGATIIEFSGGDGLDFSAIEPLQEVWIGSSPGLDNIGRGRIKGITGAGATGTVTIADNSFKIENEHHLTFKHDYPLKPKYSFIGEDETFFKDYDETYTDQNEQPPPVVIAGPHRANFIDPGALIWLADVDLTDSYPITPGATITSYGLSVYPTTGITIIFDTNTGLGTLRFAQPGQFWVKFSATDSNNKTQHTYRSYFAHNPNFMPHRDFEATVTGNWDAGGWTADITAFDNATLSEIPDKTLAILWQRSYYKNTEKVITLLPDQATNVLTGYMRREHIAQREDEGHGTVSLTFTTPEGVLKNLYTFSLSLIARPEVNHWYEYSSWQTVGTVIHHVLKHHSTSLEVMDVIGLRDNLLGRVYGGLSDNNIYGMLDNFARNEGIRAHLVCDKGGRLLLTEDVQLLPDTERGNVDTVSHITHADRMGDLVLLRHKELNTPFATASGISFEGNFDGEGNPIVGDYCSIAPGGRISDDGPSPAALDRQTVSSQEHTNDIAGRVYALTNNELPEVRVNFHGNYLGVLEVAYPHFWQMDLQIDDTKRAIVLADQNLMLRNVTIGINNDQGIPTIESVFEAEAFPQTGIATECPSFPPIGGQPEDPPVEGSLGGAIVTASSVHRKPPITKLWALLNEDDTNDIGADPWWTLKQGSFSSFNAILFRCGEGYIERSTNAGTSWTDVTPVIDPPDGPDVGEISFAFYEGNMLLENEHVFIARHEDGGEFSSWLLVTTDNGVTYEWVEVE